jgi:hypothetical protein
MKQVRKRDKVHRDFVSPQPCVICSRHPSHLYGRHRRSKSEPCKRQSVRSDGLKHRRKIAVVGRLYWEYSTPSIDRPSDILDWYSCFADATLANSARVLALHGR